MKICYKNVGSIRDAEVDYEPGKLIAIKGESNQGKSLMWYSLISGFTNSPDFKKFINNEALRENPKAIEKIDLYDDFGNFWQVEAGTNHLYYRTNKAKYEKTSRKSIFELSNSQIPGLLYDEENTTPIMNIVDEDSGMFPIDRSDAQIFKTYERLLSLSCTEDILRSIKLDLDDIDFKTADLSKNVQQNKDYLCKLDKLKQDIDFEKLDQLKSNLEQLKNDYVNFANTYETISSIAIYVDKIINMPRFSEEQFNLKYFEDLLKSYVTAINLEKYVSLKDKVFDKIDFDIANFMNISQNYSAAYQLSKDIASLTYEISTDESSLKDILLKLKEIKVCPLCGKPMEDCND